MVRTRGPTLSLDAAGSLGETVTYSSWKGRSYVKRKRLKEAANFDIHGPHQLMMAWLAAEWNQLTPVDQITWRSLAAPEHVPDYNAFMGHNLQRFHNFKSPTKRFPAGEVLTPPTWYTANPRPYDRVHSFHVSIRYRYIKHPWGYFLFLNPDVAFTPAIENLVYVGTKTAIDQEYITLRNLKPGRYKMRGRSFTPDGVLGTQTALRTGDVLDY